uniref:Uncharacterized protein n=1 Tax=Caenorhabditis japonica TaxID=281687 RepID=A0A8R1DXS1_CAEJA
MAESQPVSRKRESSGDAPEIINVVIKGTPTPKKKERLFLFSRDPQGAQGPIDEIDLSSNSSRHSSLAEDVAVEKEDDREKAVASFHSALSTSSCTTSSSGSLLDSDDEYVPEDIRKANRENANQKEDQLEKDVPQSSNQCNNQGQKKMYYAASTGCNADVDSSDELLLQYNSEEDALEEGTSHYAEQYLMDSTLDEMDNGAEGQRGVRRTNDQNEDSNQEVQVIECEDMLETEEEPTATTISGQQRRREFKRVHPAKKRKFNVRQEIRVLRNEARPVLFRKQSVSLMKTRNQKVKRNRVTRRIASHPIQQFHLADSKTELEDVEVLSLGETVENYLDASKAFLPLSEKMFDQILCAAVEYGGTVKMFHFGKDMKKNSCKQKKLRFQLSWWKKIKSQEKDKTGHLRIAEEPQLRIEDDKFLYAQHFMTPRHQRSQIQKILWRLRRRNLERRQNDDIIRDSSFFCRQFFLVKSAISLRIKLACDIPDCFIPPMMKCGYFPACAKHDHQKMDYLQSRFEEAQMEYLSLNYRDIKPPKGFRAGQISSIELWEFHRSGRHIHGFFLVWEDKVNYVNDHNGRFKRRYLVDMFNFIRFPLYVEWERWDSRLRSAFDRVILYNLHLAEVLRANRPVFDTLSRNPSLFQPLNLQESAMLMLDHEVQPRYFTNVVGKKQFYEWARRNSNMEHLSAFLMIVGGTKELHEVKEYELPRSHVYNRDAMECGMLNKDGKAYQFNSHVPIKKVFIDDNLGDEGVRLVDMQTPYTEKVKTSLIVDIPKPQLPPPKHAAKKNTRSFMTTLTRKKLMQVREKIYGVQYSKSLAPSLAELSKKGKKKPGRKPKTKMEEWLEKNDFDNMMQASDLESDYEGFKGSEEIMDFEATSKTFLKRSTSSDSIFLDYTYKECLTNRICLLHQTKLPREMEKTKKRKYRKMNRIVSKHVMRHRINASEELKEEKKVEAYHRKMPITAKHAAKTKVAMRYPSKFRKYNLPQVYEKGETNLVLEVYDVCAYLVNHVCAQEIASSRTANQLSEMVYKARTTRRAIIDEMSTVGMSQLPPPEYLAMEMLTSEQMTGRPSIITAKRKIMNEMAKATENYLDNCDPRRRYLEKDIEEYEKSVRHRKTHENEKPKEPSVLRISEKNNQEEKERLERIEKEKQDRQSEKERRNRIAKDKIEKEQMEREAIARKEKLLKERAERIARENMAKEVEAERRAKETEEKRQLEVQQQLELKKARDDALEAEKARKAGDERRRLAEHLPDHATVFLHDIVQDINNPQYREARRVFRLTNIRGLMISSAQGWAKTFFRSCGMKSDFVISELYALGDVQPRKRQFDKFQTMIFENLSRCFEYNLIAPERREWIFTYKEAYLDFDYKNRVLFDHASDNADYSYTREHTPKSTRMEQTPVPRPSQSRTLCQTYQTPLRPFHHTPAELDLSNFRTPEKFNISYRSQKIHERETNTKLDVVLRNPKLAQEKVTHYFPSTKRVSMTVRIHKTRNPNTTILKKSVSLSTPFSDKNVKKTVMFEDTEAASPDKSNEEQPQTLVTKVVETNQDQQSVTDTDSLSTVTVWKPSQNPLSEFWRIVALLQVKSISHQERSKIHGELDSLLKSSSLTNFQKVSWSYGVLTVICSLLCADFPSEHSQSGRLKNESLLQKDNCHLKVILKKLVFASQILSEACSNKSDLRSLIQYDGILLVKNAVSHVLRNLAVIALGLNTNEIFTPNSEPQSIFCELIRDVFVELRDFLATEYQITEQQLAQLEHESNLVRDSIVQLANWDLYLKHMFDGELVFRIRSINKWFTAITMEHGEDMDTIIQETYRLLNLKLSGQDWGTLERITELSSGEEHVKPDINELRQLFEKRIPIIDIDNEDDEVVIVAEYDSQGKEINVIGNTETFNKNFAKTNASVKVPTKMERKLLKKTARAKRKAEEDIEISLPSKLPKYDVTFVDKVWKSIERTFGDLSGREKQQISLYDKFGRGHKRGAFRFHMLLSVQSTIEPNASPEKKRLLFVPLRVEEEDGPRLEAENNVLAQFECQALSEEEFNKMKWHVMCNGGRSKVALEFFTDLAKFKSVKSFKKSVSNGTLDFKFKVYKHLWFMGSTLPCQFSPDSHEDNMEYNVCAGCTNGDVILVHNCTCEFHNDPHKKTTIFAYSSRPVGLYMVTRLVGRFVCEHGPSCVLQLDSEPPTAEKFIRGAAKYVQFPAKLRVFNKKTMFDELCETFTDSQTSLKNACSSSENSSSGSNIDMVMDTSSECSDESTGSTSLANTDEKMSQDNESSSGEDDNIQVPETVQDGGEIPQSIFAETSEHTLKSKQQTQSANYTEVTLSVRIPNLNSEEEKDKTPGLDDQIPHTISEIVVPLVAECEPITTDLESEKFPPVRPEILPSQSSKQVDSPVCPFKEVVGPIENPVLFGNSPDFQKTNLSTSNLHEDVPRRKQYRNFQRRSKSVDPNENGRINQAKELKRVASTCNFDFIQSYAECKIDFITEKYRTDHVHEYFDLGAIPLDNKSKEEMQELANLIEGLTHLSYRESEEVFISLMAIHSSNTTQMVNFCNKELDRIRRSTEKFHLYKYRGTDINSDLFPEFQNDTMVSGESISIVMDEYYKFVQFKKDVMFDASIALDVIRGMRTEYLKAFPMLFTAYEMMLSFNRSLLEHMLYLVAKHVFNPYAVFEAESEQNVERIRERLNNVKSAMSMVKNAFFNLEPLRRQADELKEIQKRVPPNEMKLVVASLAKLVIERVRAPQTVDVVLGKFGSWLNSSKDFKETVNLLMFSIKDTLPEASVCNRMLSEAEEMCFEPDLVDAQCRMFSHDYALPIPEFFRAVFWQSEVFLRCLDSCSLGGAVDPYMRSYYGHKSFLRMYNLIQRKTFLTREDVIAAPHTTNAMVFSTICGTEKRNYDLLFDAHNLNNYYERLLQYPTTQYLIEPSHIGVVFCCFDNCFFVAAVNEKPVNVLPNYEFPNTSCIRSGEISIDVEYPSCTITLMLNRQTLMLSMVFMTVEGVGKDDRLELDVLPVSMVHEDRGEFTVDWQLIVETYISQGYNLLKYIMGPRKIGNTSILKVNENKVSRRHKLVDNWLRKERKLVKSIRKRRRSRPVDICDNGKKSKTG